jgi:glycosyltransferase involved in cell wall biosynthesis
MTGKIAYIMSRFPHLPETFILREINELARQGWQIALYPLLVQQETVVHAEAEAWLQDVRQIPFMSREVLAGNGRLLRQQPAHTTRLWWQTLVENMPDPHMLARALALFPKAAQAAVQMQAEGVRHIHAHYATHPAFFAWLIHQLTGISYSITVHAHDIFVRTTMLATKLRSAQFVVAISDYNREYLARIVGSWVREKTHVSHCGITPSLYQPRTADQEKRPLQIINVGSLQPYKGQSYLIRACALLKKQGLPFRCRIIGGGAERANLQSLIEQLHLAEEVQLLGPLPQEDVAALLPTANCYVQPSIVTPSGKMEGIPVALMEALACCVPVIATELSGVPELVKHGQTGFLVPPADEVALAQALNNLYETPGIAWTTALAGREHVLGAFDLVNNVAELALLFQEVAGQTAPH